MKKVLFMVAGLLFAGSVFAADLNVAVVDLQKVVQNSKQLNAIKDTLKKQFNSREDKIIAAQDKLKADVDKLNRDTAVLKKEDRASLQQKIVEEQRALQPLQMAFQRDYFEARDKALQGLYDQVRGVITKIAQKNNYDLVLTNVTVAFMNPKFDITAQVASQLGN